MVLLNHALVPTIVLLEAPCQGLGVIQVITRVDECLKINI